MRKLFKATSVWAFMALNVSASKYFNADQATQLYIKKYTALSTYESMRSGIPTSVILAQGILESRSGLSELTQKTNNHFCIKWRNSMKNFENVKFKDDTYNKKGEKIAEPFVKYATVEESYSHHSDFLRSNSIYNALFALHRDDYKNWCLGLQKCGYATSTDYAQNLLHIIEVNKLYLFDIPESLNPDSEVKDSSEPIIAEVEAEQLSNIANNLSEGFYEYVIQESAPSPVTTKSVSKTAPFIPVKKMIPHVSEKNAPGKAVEGFYEYSTGKQ